MAGFRDFQTGEVLTAANVNDFLMQQSVMKFADAAARDTALGTAVGGANALREGMVAYLDSTDEVLAYNGTAWSALGNAGIGSNVVQATKLDTFSTTSTSYTDITGLTATITPSSATAKVLIVVQLNVSTTPTDGHITAVGIGGGNAAAYVGATASNRTTMASGVRLGTPYDYSRSVVTLSVVYLDSPATTSATTYAAQVKAVGGTAYVNRSHFDDNNNTHPRAASSITVIEVAA